MNVAQAPEPKKTLAEHHREQLHASGLKDEYIDKLEWWTTDSTSEVQRVLGRKKVPSGQCLMIPHRRPDGTCEFVHVRPNNPRTDSSGKLVKYETPRRQAPEPYFASDADRLKDAALPLVITEGQKTGAALDSLGYPTVALTGINLAHDVEHRKATGEWRLHPLISDFTTIEGRECFVAIDRDSTGPKRVKVYKAAEKIAGMLRAAGAKSVKIVVPPGQGSKKIGFDEMLAADGSWAVHKCFGRWTNVKPMFPGADMPPPIGMAVWRKYVPRDTSRLLKGLPPVGAPTIDSKTPVALWGLVTYVSLPDHVVRDQSISWAAKSLLAIWKWNPRLGQVKTADRLGCTERWVRKLSKELQAAGYISFRPRVRHPVIEEKKLKVRRTGHMVGLPWFVLGRLRDEHSWLYALIHTKAGATPNVYASERELAEALGMSGAPATLYQAIRRRVRVLEKHDLIARHCRDDGQPIAKNLAYVTTAGHWLASNYFHSGHSISEAVEIAAKSVTPTHHSGTPTHHSATPTHHSVPKREIPGSTSYSEKSQDEITACCAGALHDTTLECENSDSGGSPTPPTPRGGRGERRRERESVPALVRRHLHPDAWSLRDALAIAEIKEAMWDYLVRDHEHLSTRARWHMSDALAVQSRLDEMRDMSEAEWIAVVCERADWTIAYWDTIVDRRPWIRDKQTPGPWIWDTCPATWSMRLCPEGVLSNDEILEEDERGALEVERDRLEQRAQVIYRAEKMSGYRSAVQRSVVWDEQQEAWRLDPPEDLTEEFRAAVLDTLRKEREHDDVADDELDFVAKPKSRNEEWRSLA